MNDDEKTKEISQFDKESMIIGLVECKVCPVYEKNPRFWFARECIRLAVQQERAEIIEEIENASSNITTCSISDDLRRSGWNSCISKAIAIIKARR